MNLDLYLAEKSTKSVMVFPIGNWKTAKYPKLPLSEKLADNLIKNFDDGVLGATEPFVDSSGRHDEGAPAAGWIKRLYKGKWEKGEALFADVSWTNVGEDIIKNKLYKYISPVIASHVIPESGKEVFPVLRSMSLTNVPVLRMMPPVALSEQFNVLSGEMMEIVCSDLIPLEIGEEVEEEIMPKSNEEEVVASEVALAPFPPVAQPAGFPPAAPPAAAPVPDMAPPEDPAMLVTQIMAMMQKLSALLKGKQGMPAMRSLMREALAKASTYLDEEDSAVWEVMLTELTDGKEMSMSKVAEYFELSEDATEDEIVKAAQDKVIELTEAKTEVETKLSEVTTAKEEAESKLAEIEAAKAKSEVEFKLSEAVTANIVKPAEIGDEENPGWLRKLAFKDITLFEEAIESRKTPAVDTGELGSGENTENTPDDRRADIRLSETAKKIQTERGVGVAEAQRLALSEDKELFEDYKKYRESTR